MTNKFRLLSVFFSLLVIIGMNEESLAATMPAPTVVLSASPSTVTSGNKSKLSWSATLASSCIASGAWTGDVKQSGIEETAALKADETYTLSCTGPGGTVVKHVTVSVPSSPPPKVVLSASPSTVTSGNKSKLGWSATYASSCTASGAWTGSVKQSGDEETAALKADSTYALKCTGPGGTSSESTTVTVKAATVTGDATLSWAAPTKNTNGTAVKLTGYHLYFGNSTEALTKSVAVAGATSTSYEITGLTVGTWYFAVAADSSDGTESAKSEVGSKTI